MNANPSQVQALQSSQAGPMAKYINSTQTLKKDWKFKPKPKPETQTEDFLWEHIKTHATPEQKRVFSQIREKLIKQIEQKINKCDFNFYRYGSTSLDSDVDITIIPNLTNLITTSNPVPKLSTAYLEIMKYYHNKFKRSMNDMFNMNIYACPFFYVTDLNFTQTVNMYKLTSSNSNSPPERLSPKFAMLRCSTLKSISPSSCGSPSSATSSGNRSSQSGLPLEECTSMFCLQVEDETIEEVQFPYMIYYLTDKKELLDLYGLKQPRSEAQVKSCIQKSYKKPEPYEDLIKAYENIVFSNPNQALTLEQKKENTKKALHILTKATFFMEDAYHTQGAVLHVTCPEEYRVSCFNTIAPNHFLCSVFENLGYANKYIKNQQKQKAIKYVERFTEALMLYIIRRYGGYLKGSEVYSNLLYCPRSSPQAKSICTEPILSTYIEIYNLYTKAKSLNCKRKNDKLITSDELKDIPADDICKTAYVWLTNISIKTNAKSF